MNKWIDKSQPGEAPDATEPNRQLPDDMRTALTQILADEDMSRSELARQLGYSLSTISLYLRGEYRGNVAEIERAAADWLATRSRRMVIGVPLIECDVTRQVFTAIEQVRRTNDFGLIFGDAGIGKTCAATLYAERNATCILITVQEWVRDMWGLEKRIFDAVDHGGWDRKVKRGDYIVAKLRGSNRPMIIDNAHKLTRQALQWLIDFHDETRCPITLIGNENIMPKIVDLDQRFSRVGNRKVVTVRRPRELIQHLKGVYGIDDSDALDDLCEVVVDNQGRFRALAKNLGLAALIREASPETSWEKAFRSGFERLVRTYQLPAPTSAKAA